MSSQNYEPSVPLVMIVDDDLTTSLTLDGLLRGVGLKTIRASSLAEAESIFRSYPVALILLDVHLPDGNGLDLCRRLTDASSVPVLFISADGDVATKTDGFGAGGVDYITKPLSGAEVLARVRTHLRLRAAQETLSALYAERLSKLSAAQQALMPLPANLPHAGFQVCIRQTLQAGGDFYDVLPVSSNIVDYVVADASGHDLGVSLWTASFKTLLSECTSAINTPRDICRSINDSLRRVLPEGTYFTALHVRLERSANRLVLVNAGHPSAIFVDGQNRQARLVKQDGDILGVFEDASFGVAEVPVRTGDRLYLYTDGLVEMHGSIEDGCARLIVACEQTACLSLADSVRLIVDEMSCGQAPEDDIVLLGVEI